MSSVNEIAERHVARFAELDPVTATAFGLVGFDDRMTDLSPDAFAARNSIRAARGLAPSSTRGSRRVASQSATT